MAKRSAAMLLALEQDMPALRLGMAPNRIVILSLQARRSTGHYVTHGG